MMEKEKTKKKSLFKRQIPLYIMTIPGVIYLIINNYMPMCGLFIAFKNIDYSKGIWAVTGSDWKTSSIYLRRMLRLS